MIQEAIELLWFLLPGAYANMAPVLANHIRALRPLGFAVDGGRTWRGRRLLGDHKTLRGFVAGWVVASLVLIIQYTLFRSFSWVRGLTLFDYDSLNFFALSLALGLGPLVGDAVKSFFKRQLDIAPGANWVPFDQIDFVLGGLFFLSFIVDLTLRQVLLSLAIALIFHPAVNVIGWLLRLKDNPF